ncbi:MAG: hypothetical protein ACJ785_08065 [Gemmatimonadaceae bacterium]
MKLLLTLHITAGSLAIIAGFIAIFAVKGARLHRQSGKIFVYSMLGLGITGAIIAAIKSQPANVVGGSLAVYMVGTGVLTLRRRDQNLFWVELGALILAVGITYFSLTTGLRGLHSASGRINGLQPYPLFVFAGVTLLAALGDVRMLIVRGLVGRQRLIRHLWRMCFSLFIASGSFFLGQAKVIPKPIRFFPVLFVLAFLPLVLLLYWMVRVLFTRWYRRSAQPFIEAPDPPAMAAGLNEQRWWQPAGAELK